MIGNHVSLLNASMIIFFNKKDVFREKLFGRSRRHHVAMDNFMSCFPDYCGTKNYKEMCNFILSKFEVVCCSQPSTSSVKEPSKQRCRAEIYHHFTCATDTEGIRVVFDAVIDLVTQSSMEQCGLV